MQNPASKRHEMQSNKAVQEGKIQKVPDENDIPVPPGEDIPAPVKEPYEEDKPNEPIIDDETNAPKLIV